MLSWLGILFLVLSLLLILIDLLFIPTVILSLLSVLGYLTFLLYLYHNGEVTLAVTLFISFISCGSGGAFLALRYKWWKIISNQQSLPRDESMRHSLNALTGQTAVTLSPLRPTGKILLAGKRYDAIASSAGFIAANVSVRILKVSSAQLEVIKVPPA